MAEESEVLLYQLIVDSDTLPTRRPYDVDLLVRHTADEDAELFQRPMMRLAEEHGRAFRSIYARTPARTCRTCSAAAWARGPDR